MKEAKFEVGFYGEGFSEGAILGEGLDRRKAYSDGGGVTPIGM